MLKFKVINFIISLLKLNKIYSRVNIIFLLFKKTKKYYNIRKKNYIYLLMVKQ